VSYIVVELPQIELPDINCNFNINLETYTPLSLTFLFHRLMKYANSLLDAKLRGVYDNEISSAVHHS